MAVAFYIPSNCDKFAADNMRTAEETGELFSLTKTSFLKLKETKQGKLL